jgi:heterodisulfide reductase subunit C
MEKWQGWPKIQFESELDPGFADEIASIPGGEKLFSCIQCGTCSGMCPLSPCMDHTPRQIIAMIRAGFKEDVMSSRTTWLCASCYACAVECPKDINITDLMYAAKRVAIREGAFPKRLPIPILAREFFAEVEKTGRSTESWLLVRLFLKTNPFDMLKQAGLGMRLWLKGRMTLRRESIKRRGELHKMLKTLDRQHMVKSQRELQAEEREIA